jgi:DNA polymerase-3 subunit delta
LATRTQKTKEHAFKRIQKDLKEGLGNPLFFYGEEQYLVRWATDLIVEHYVEPNLRQLNCSRLERERATVEAIIEQCETLPMLSEKRVVIVEDFPAGGESIKESYTEAEENALIEYLKELPDSCLLILTADSVDKRRKLYKAIAAAGSCYEFSRLSESEIRSFIQKRLKQWGKTAAAGVISHMIAMSGYLDRQSDYTLYNLENDIKKLIAHCDDDVIRLKDVAAALSGNTETYVFDMINSISNNRKDEALLLLHNLLASGENVYRLLALICSHYELILMVKEMREEGLSLGEIKTATGAHEYRVKIAGENSRLYSVKQLRRILSRCFDVEKNIKTGLLDERLALEMLVANL